MLIIFPSGEAVDVSKIEGFIIERIYGEPEHYLVRAITADNGFNVDTFKDEYDAKKCVARWVETFNIAKAVD